jgi:hypothetical protein
LLPRKKLNQDVFEKMLNAVAADTANAIDIQAYTFHITFATEPERSATSLSE